MAAGFLAPSRISSSSHFHLGGGLMGYFPFFMDLSGQPGLVVGGGAVALRKVQKLLPYGPSLTVVSPQFTPELLAIPNLTLVQRPFQAQDLDTALFVIAATDQVSLNHTVSRLCRSRRIPVNVVDDKNACTFLFPALVQKGALSVGISTSGSSPAAAVWLKDEIDALLPRRMEDILFWLESQRPLLKARCPQASQRAALSARLFSACLAAGRPLDKQELFCILDEEALP